MNNQNTVSGSSIEELQEKLAHTQSHAEKREIIADIRGQVQRYQLQICELVNDNDLDSFKGGNYKNLGIHWDEFKDTVERRAIKYDNNVKNGELYTQISKTSPANFIKERFDIDILGNVEIKYHDNALEIFAEDEIDYKNLYAGMLFPEGEERTRTYEESKPTLGALIFRGAYNYIIINCAKCGENKKMVLSHEWQHVRYNMIGEDVPNTDASIGNFQLDETNSSKDLVKKISEYFRPLLENALIEAKDEIIAITVDQTSNYAPIYNKGEDASYDFTFQNRKYIAHEIQGQISHLTENDIKNLFSFLFMFEYAKIIGNIVTTVRKNRDKTDLLSIVPLSGWHRLENLKGDNISRTNFTLNMSKNIDLCEEFLNSKHNVYIMNNKPVDLLLSQLGSGLSTLSGSLGQFSSKISHRK